MFSGNVHRLLAPATRSFCVCLSTFLPLLVRRVRETEQLQVKGGSCGFYYFFRNPEESFYIVIHETKGYSPLDLISQFFQPGSQTALNPKAQGNLPSTPLVPPSSSPSKNCLTCFSFPRVRYGLVQMCPWWPARLPALCLPSFKVEERARVSNRDMDD